MSAITKPWKPLGNGCNSNVLKRSVRHYLFQYSYWDFFDYGMLQVFEIQLVENYSKFEVDNISPVLNHCITS